MVLQADPRHRRPGVEGLARLGDKANEVRFKRDFQREKNDELRAAYAFAIFLFGDRPSISFQSLGSNSSGKTSVHPSFQVPILSFHLSLSEPK